MDYVYNYNDMQFFVETKNDIEERIHKIESRLSLEYSDTSFKELIIIIMYCFIRMGDVFVLGQRKLFRAENI